MVYGKEPFAKRAQQLFEAYGIGVKVIMGVLTTAFLASEWQRIRSLPLKATNYLYLALLLAIVALVGCWIIFSKLDLVALADWLDPENYHPPNEVMVIAVIGLALALLLLAARDPILFGGAYILYGATNLAASRHMRREFMIALDRSRKRLDEDRRDKGLADAVAIYEKALLTLENFMVRRPNLARLWLVLGLSSLGLALAVYSKLSGYARSGIAAYIVYLLTLTGPEIGLMMAWRQSLYGQLRPLTAARYELFRARGMSSDA